MWLNKQKGSDTGLKGSEKEAPPQKKKFKKIN